MWWEEGRERSVVGGREREKCGGREGRERSVVGGREREKCGG